MLGWILAIIALLTALTIFGAGYAMFRLFMCRPKKRLIRYVPKAPVEFARRTRAAVEWIETHPHEDFHMESADGLKLHALYIPSAQPTANYILAIHGYMANGIKEFAAYAPYYHERGYNLLLVDLRGHGKSEGRFVTFGYHDRQDCFGWCEYLCERFGSDINIAIHGISMGAATSIMTAALRPKCLRGVISDCGYSDLWPVFKHIIKQRVHFIPRLSMQISSLLASHALGFSARRDCRPCEEIKQAECPFLFIHGAADNFVPTYMVHELYNACPTPKTRLVIPDAGHARSFWADTDKVSENIENFLSDIDMPPIFNS